MPKAFTNSFAERLNAMAQIKVKEAENNESLRPGLALVAPGDTHMVIRRRGRDAIVELMEDQRYVYRPSVDLLLSTVAGIYESKAIAVILTGMGTDGLNGAREVRGKNGFVIAQDEKSSAVYGMPRAVAEARLASSIVPAHQIAREIMRAL
jgi:two-component system chemotaxis response regulator CheB